MQANATSLVEQVPSKSKTQASFTRYQKLVVAILTFLQFTIILDFMILSPLGALLMPAFHMSTTQFGFVVSVYAFSAGASGFLAGGFADRFDRKKLLLFFYCGFIVGTLLCALAPNYLSLLAARMITGIFGGVIGSIAFAITTDLFPIEMRGRVMGYIQTSFAASQVMGLPFAVFLSTYWGWQAPFLMLVVTSSIVAMVIWRWLQPIDAHLKLHSLRSPFRHLLDTICRPRYVHAFATMALLSTGGFMLMPFGSAFSVYNLGIGLETLPLVYMVTGVCSFMVGPLIGRLSDRIGSLKMFNIGSGVSIVMVIIYTHLEVTPVPLVIFISVLMFIGITSRMIASQAFMSAIPEPASRGSFMSVASSIQQVSGGLAAMLAGFIVVQEGQGPLAHFDTLGYVVVAAILMTMIMMYSMARKV